MKCLNAIVNKRLCPHHCFFDFVQGSLDWFCDGFIEYEQFIKHDMVNTRLEKKILKSKLLNEWCFFIADTQTNDDILSFLKETSNAMKANEEIFHEMLK